MNQPVLHQRRQPRKAVTFRLSQDVIDDLKATCRDGAGKPLYLRIGGVIEDAIRAHLVVIKQQMVQPSTKPH